MSKTYILISKLVEVLAKMQVILLNGIFLLLMLLFQIPVYGQDVPVMDNLDTKTASGSGTSLNIERPHNVLEGDLILLLFTQQLSSRFGDSGFTTPDGFKQIRVEHASSSSSTPQIVAFYKIAGENEPKVYTSTVTEYTTTPNWKAVAMRVTGHDPVSPIATNSGANSGNTLVQSLNIHSLSTINQNSLLIGAVTVRREIRNEKTPDGIKELWFLNGTGNEDNNSNAPAFYGGIEPIEEAGATGTRSFSWTGYAKAAGLMFAINPDVSTVDLEITNVPDNATPAYSSQISFTITANNNWFNSATGVKVSCPLPNGYVYLSHSASQGNYHPKTGIWIIGNLNNYASSELCITAIVACPGNLEYDFTASISGAQPDNDPTNNNATANVKPFGDCPVVAIDDYVETIQGNSVIFNVLTNDIGDLDSEGFDDSNIVSNPIFGNIVVGSKGDITYTPIGNYIGNDSFKYKICSIHNPEQCSEATVYVTVNSDLFNVCYDAVQSHIYYLPFPEHPNFLLKALRSAANQNPNQTTVRNIVSIKVNYPKTIIIYDHWEDGYEADITEPTQSTTEIWGDGNPANGVAPGYPDDIIPPGGQIIIDKTFAYNRNQLQIEYDGRDKIFSSSDITISKITGSNADFNVQNVKTDVIDVSRFGKSFTIGFGEDLTKLGNAHNAFRYVGLFVRASEDNTLVELDYNGDGIIDVTKILNEGEVWLYDGTASTPGDVNNDVNKYNDIKTGAQLIADKPVGVDIVFGGIDNYGTRNIYILPSKFYGSKYITPVHTTLKTAPVVAYFYNSSDTPMTLKWEAGTGQSGAIEIPAKGINFLTLNQAAGYEFESEDGRTYTAIAVVDADNEGRDYDWAYPLVPVERLTNFASIAWAPGSNDLSANYNPIWVTPTKNTTIYVKWDGDITSNTGNISPCGIPFDANYPVGRLQSLKLYDNSSNDNDQSGASIYTCDGTTFSAVWGQDANAGNPTPISGVALDVGYLMLPRCLDFLILANDDRAVTEPEIPVIIDVLSNDAGFLCTLDPGSVTTDGFLQPTGGNVVISDDGIIIYTPNPGFTGTDEFEYQVCSKEYPHICEIALVKVIVRPCDNEASSAGVNIVKGRVYIEQLPDNGQYDGEDFVCGVAVELYADNNCNNEIDSGDQLIETIVSDVNGRFDFVKTGTKYARDIFPTLHDYDANQGTINWSGAWSINNNDRVYLLEDPIPSDADNIALCFSGNNNYAQRSLEFIGATSAVLKFSYRREDLKNANDKLIVSFNGHTQIEIDNAGNINTDLFYHDMVVSLSNIYADAPNLLKFETNGTVGNNSYFFIDNVELIYFPACYIVKVDTSITNGKFEAAVLNEGTITFDNQGYCSDDVYLGVRALLTAVDDEAKVISEVPKVIYVLANDIGNPDPAKVSIHTSPLNGQIEINPDGSITYIPDPDYEGPDSFKYTVCSADDPDVCSTATVNLNVTCISIPGINVINGIAFGDINGNGLHETGENGLQGIEIELYNDLNGNGELDNGEPLLQTITTDATGGYQFELNCNLLPEHTVADNFNTRSYSRNDGTDNWISNWEETGDDGSPTSGNIFITLDGKLCIIRKDVSDSRSICRTADLSGSVSATLTYTYDKSKFIDHIYEFVDIEISTNGYDWTQLKRYSGAAQASGTETFDISEYISPTTSIRFLESSISLSSTDKSFTIDDLQISFFIYTPHSNNGLYVEDNFSVQSYDNNHGTINWKGKWIENDDPANDPTNGSIFITPETKLRVQGDGSSNSRSIRREVDLSNAAFATLVFTYSKSSFSHESNDWVNICVAADPLTSNLQQLKRISGVAASNGTEVIPIPSIYFSENTTIHIFESNNINFTSNEYVLFDDITIVFSHKDYIVKAKEPLPDGYSFSPGASDYHHVSFNNDCGIGSCSNNFALWAADLEIEKK